MVSIETKLNKLLHKIYSPKVAEYANSTILKIIHQEKNQTKKAVSLSEKDAALITYADSLSVKGKKPLATLKTFVTSVKLNKTINTAHILPFYPWDTDRGFSVMDYYKVKSDYGDWNDIKLLGKFQKLMFDFVANHISIDNPIAQEALIAQHVKDYKTKYKDFLICYTDSNKPSESDLQKLARPRPNPVLTQYFISKSKLGYKAILGIPKPSQKTFGHGYVWTTFSRPKNADGSESTRQVDLNFKNPEVLIETIKILLFYIKKKAFLIRLDAIGYIWKHLGSSSLHEDEAHLILRVIYLVLKKLHPEVVTVAEINEPQDKVLTYLGSSKKPESDIVYQFTHFPLAIYSLIAQDSTEYQKWLMTTKAFKGKQFITVLGSHDGLGLKPVRGILKDSEVQMIEKHLIQKHKALPNYAILPGGKKIIYEICGAPWNLINPTDSSETTEVQIKKYIVVVALGLLVKGLPAFYINGLVASKNYQPKKGLDENRTINREQLNFEPLLISLSDNNSIQHKVFQLITKLLAIRQNHPEFSPTGQFPEIVDTNNKAVLGVLLKNKSGKKKILSLINVSNKKQIIILPKKYKKQEYLDLITNSSLIFLEENITLTPYQVLWLK